MSENGGKPTTSQGEGKPTRRELLDFYRYAMLRCDQLDREWRKAHWTQTEDRERIQQDLEKLISRLAQCASAVPDDERIDALAEIFGERLK